MDASPSRWWVLANLVVANVVVTGIAWNYLIMFVPEVTADLGLDVSSWGMLWSGIPLGVLLFSLPAGAVGDRLGVRVAFAAGLAVAAGSLLLRGVTAGPISMMASMVGFGLALALILALLPKALAQSFSASELGMANGVAQAGVGLGLGAATILAPWMARALGGWRELSVALGAASGILALAWYASIRDPLPPSTRPTGPSDAPSILEALRIPQVLGLAGCYALYMGGYLGAVGYLPTHMVSAHGLSTEAAGALMSLGPWAFVAGSVLLPTLSDRIGRRRAVYGPGMAAGGLALWAACVSTGYSALGISIAILGFGTGVVGLLFVILVETEGVGERLAGTAVGAINAAGFLGGALSPVLVMPLVASSPELGFGLWTACFVASAAFILLLSETGRRSSA